MSRTTDTAERLFKYIIRKEGNYCFNDVAKALNISETAAATQMKKMAVLVDFEIEKIGRTKYFSIDIKIRNKYAKIGFDEVKRPSLNQCLSEYEELLRLFYANSVVRCEYPWSC